MSTPKAKYVITADDRTAAAWKSALGSADKGTRAIRNLVASAFTIGAATRAFKSIVQITDQYTLLNGRLALVTESTAELADVQEELFNIAQRTRTEYTGVADLYIKLSQSGKELGASQEQLLRFTEGIGNALTVSGASAQTASGALLQLSQALASGTVRAEEYNSINEGAPEILRTVARNMDGVGGSLGKLRAEVLAGNVSSQEFFAAFLKGSEQLKEQAQSMPVTVGQAFTRLQNNVNAAIAGTNMEGLTSAITEFSEIVKDPATIQGIDAFATGLATLATWMAQLASNTATATKSIAEDFAAIIHGAAAGDLERLNEQLELLQEMRASSSGASRIRFFGKDGLIEFYNNEELDEEIRNTKELIRLAEQAMEFGRAGPVTKRATPDNTVGTPVSFSGDRAANLNNPVEPIYASTRKMIDDLDKDLRKFFADTDEANEKALQNVDLNFRETIETMSVFQEEAFRGMQQHFADFLFDPFDEGLDGMAKGFIDTIRRMLAEAASAKLFEALFGSAGSSGGGGGGIWGTVLSAVGSFFGGGKAEGGPLQPGKWHIAGEHGPEPIWGGGPGAFAMGYPGGGGTNVTINMPVDMRGATVDAVKLFQAREPQLIRQAADLAKAEMRDDRRRGR